MRRKLILITFLIIFMLANLFIPTDEAHFLWEKLPIFNSILGFLGCLIIIIVSKGLGKFLQRNEDYYD